MLCLFGFHRWTGWATRRWARRGRPAYFDMQERHCQKCGKRQCRMFGGKVQPYKGWTIYP